METSLTNTQLEQFRQEPCHSFERCANALMELLDTPASQTLARSAVELCLDAGRLHTRFNRRLYEGISSGTDQGF